MKRLHWSAAAKSNSADMYIYGTIGPDFWDDGGITDSEVATALAQMSGVETLKVHIDSPGGDAAQGIAIYNLLVQAPQKIETVVEGWAASAASIIMQAGDVRTVAENGLVMIHNAWGFSAGNKNDLRKLAEILDKLDASLALTYTKRSGGTLTQEQAAALMDAETWFAGQEAVDQGLADAVMAAKGPQDSVAPLRAASIALRPQFAKLAQYRNAPKDDDEGIIDRMRMRLALGK